MEGTGNLIEVSDKYLHDTITSAKMSRSSSSVVTILLYCATVGSLAEKAGIVDECVEALVECWLKPPTRFSSPTNKRTGSEKDRMETHVHSLLSLPVDWFVKIVTLAKERGVSYTELGEMSIKYVSKAMERDNIDDIKSEIADQSSNPDLKQFEKNRKVDIAKVLDKILAVLPEEAYAVSGITTEWITKVLRLATARGCACRGLLVKIAGEMLNNLPPEDLCIISPSVLHDIVLESARGDTEHALRAYKLVDTYMLEMSKKGVLTSETFKFLAAVAPTGSRSSHDELYGILEYVLKTEKGKLSQELRQELLAMVNFNLMSEVTLKRAFDSDVIPHTYVAQGALSLCQKLKSELDSVKYIAEMQEDELAKVQNSAVNSPWTVARNTDSGFSDARESPPKGSPDTTDAVKAAQDILTAARTKMNTSAFSNPRPLHLVSPGSSYSHGNTLEHDISLEEELEFKFDRTFRSLDQRGNQRRPQYNITPSHYTSSQSTHRSYYPYTSHRY